MVYYKIKNVEIHLKQNEPSGQTTATTAQPTAYLITNT